MSRLFVALFFVLLAACSSAPKKTESPIESKLVSTVAAAEEENIDYLSIQRSLGLSREIDNLGYAEKAFNTCEMGFGFSRSQNCHKEIFAVVHFQLLCRDSQGTISTALTRDDMEALAGRKIRWSLHKKSGSVVLDHDGHGQILMSFPQSPKYQRLKLAAGNDALYLKAGEIKRVVTPSNWCNQ